MGKFVHRDSQVKNKAPGKYRTKSICITAGVTVIKLSMGISIITLRLVPIFCIKLHKKRECYVKLGKRYLKEGKVNSLSRIRESDVIDVDSVDAEEGLAALGVEKEVLLRAHILGSDGQRVAERLPARLGSAGADNAGAETQGERAGAAQLVLEPEGEGRAGHGVGADGDGLLQTIESGRRGARGPVVGSVERAGG